MAKLLVCFRGMGCTTTRLTGHSIGGPVKASTIMRHMLALRPLGAVQVIARWQLLIEH